MGNKRLTILRVNDTHSYLEEHQEMFWDGKKHAKIDGYAKISGYFKQVRNERGTIVAIRQFFF